MRGGLVHRSGTAREGSTVFKGAVNVINSTLYGWESISRKYSGHNVLG